MFNPLTDTFSNGLIYRCKNSGKVARDVGTIYFNAA